jgi:nitrate reductase NapE component
MVFIKALIVILSLVAATFWVAGKALPSFLAQDEFKKWRNAWYTVLFIGALAHNIWVYAVVLFCFAFFVLSKKKKDRVIYFLLLFSVLPMLSVEVPGAFGIRIFLVLNYPLILVFGLLIGAYLQSSAYPRWLSLKTDTFVLLYFVFVGVLSFRDDTFTNGLRDALTIFLKFILPYFVISRYLNDVNQLNRGLMAVLLGVIPLAPIGIFETAKHWHVYDPVVQALRGGQGATGAFYDVRSGELRASVIYGSPIAFGYVLVILFGILLYVKPFIANQRFANLAGAVIILSLLATMARGPWVGLVCLYFAYLWTGPGGMAKIAGWTLTGILSAPLLLLSPAGQTFMNLLPFVGEERTDTVDYRAELMRQSWIVFWRHPWFGSSDYMETPELESMRQGQGIIDIVNTYVEIALEYGLAGLFFFVLTFFGLLLRCYLILPRIPRDEVDLLRMGRVLFAILTAIVLMIGTVSSISYIPYFYWVFAGITVAYLNVAEKTIKARKTSLL